jgi:hypothetical protein
MAVSSCLGLAAQLFSQGTRSAFAALVVATLVAGCGLTGTAAAPGSAPASVSQSPTVAISPVVTPPTSSGTPATTVVALPANPPTIGGTPATTVQATKAYTFTPVASSPRSAILTFSIANKPAWATFSTSTGQVSGTPASANVGTFPSITISVNDGTGTASLAPFTAAVTSPPPPTISGTPGTSVMAVHAYTFTPTASSPSGAALTFSIAGKPAWASFNTATGQLAGTPATTDTGTFANVTISLTDGVLTASLAPFTITVQAGTTYSATVSWTAPTARIDGTPLTNLAGYHIHYGTSQGNYPNVIAVTNPGLTTYVVENLPSGATYYFVATAYDANGLESGDSNVASKTI